MQDDTQRPDLYPETFQVHNFYVDKLFGLLTPIEWYVLTYAIRSIMGWPEHRATRQDRISLSQFIDGKSVNGYKVGNGTDLTKTTVIKTLRTLHRFGILIKVGDPTGDGQTYELQGCSDQIDIEGLQDRKLLKQAKSTRKQPVKPAAPDPDPVDDFADVKARQPEFIPRQTRTEDEAKTGIINAMQRGAQRQLEIANGRTDKIAAELTRTLRSDQVAALGYRGKIDAMPGQIIDAISFDDDVRDTAIAFALLAGISTPGGSSKRKHWTSEIKRLRADYHGQATWTDIADAIIAHKKAFGGDAIFDSPGSINKYMATVLANKTRRAAGVAQQDRYKVFAG